jgi:hypothetical protein
MPWELIFMIIQWNTIEAFGSKGNGCRVIGQRNLNCPDTDRETIPLC